jgi:hypothetical protein
MASFYYDPAYTLQIIFSIQSPAIITKLSQSNNKPIEEYQNQGPLSTMVFYFQTLFDCIKDMERDFTERLIVLSFLSILSLPSHTLPELIQINLPSMFQQVIREILLIEEEAKKQAEEGDEDEDEDDDDDFEDDGDDDDFDDDFGGSSSKKNAKGKDYSLRQVEDEDEDDEDFDENDPSQAHKNRNSKLHVPEGGYDENDDCINCEDEEYRQVLEDLNEEDKVKRQKFMAGEPVDDEEDDDFIYTSPIENIPMSTFFVGVMTELSTRDQQQNSNFIDFLKRNLNAEDHERLNNIVQMANEQVAARQEQLSPK